MPKQNILPIDSHRPEDLVFITALDEIVTTSILVAKHFGKRHSHVLDRIRNLDCSPTFGCTNFSAHPYQHEQNGETYDCYHMTKDGFMFLVMGFTGKKAAIIKEAYINAFNAMAEQLQKNNASLPIQTLTLPDFYRQHILLTVEKGEIVHRRLLEQDEMVINRNNLDHYMRDPEVFSIEQLIKCHHSFNARLESFMQAKLR